MSKITVIVKKNAAYEKGEYGYSVHEEGAAGMSANVVPTNQAGLKEVLKEFGCTDDFAREIIGRLEKQLDSVKFEVEQKTTTKGSKS